MAISPPLTTAQKLAQAEIAYHNLMVNGAVRVVVDQNGERVEYTAVNAANLARYIEELKRQLAAEGGYIPASRGPGGVIF